MKRLVAIILFLASLARGGDFVDLGTVEKVPNWAIGPLLILPVDRVNEGRLVAKRDETRRIGTIQVNFAEINGERLTFDEIRLREIPNDSNSCEITTKPKAGKYFKIHLSQNLFDQTFYYVYIEKYEVGDERAIEENQHVVWDIKSRK